VVVGCTKKRNHFDAARSNRPGDVFFEGRGSVANILDIHRKSAFLHIGRTVADYRNRLGQVMTQEVLAEKFNVSRTSIAHLEEGEKLLSPDLLEPICELLKIPEHLWVGATHVFYIEGYVFHELACELTGRHTSISEHTATDQIVALDRAHQLFTSKLTAPQAHAQCNALLTFYGERPMTRPFFDKYFGVDAFASTERLRGYQSEAMRLYGNFRRAFIRMSRVDNLAEELSPLQPHSLDTLKARSAFSGVIEIAADRLADLGYIAAQRIEQQNKERHELSAALNALAVEIDKKGQTAVHELTGSKLRRLRTLLRKFESPILLEEGLFASYEPELLRNEAARIAPERQDLARIAETQRTGLRNLGVYLSEPYMDV
jgi:transcriptional regulator with XRE-family HTH domain